MSDESRINDLASSDDTVVLNGGEFDIVRFLYEKEAHPRPSIDIVLRRKENGERIHYRFHDVELHYLPPIQSFYPLLMTNLGRRQHEVPRDLAISIEEEHPDTGVLFFASSVEILSESL